MPFPLSEIQHGGTYAFITTLTNQIKIFAVKPIHGRVFYVPDLGIFQLHEDYRYILGRAEIYFYNQKGCNPLSFDAAVNIKDALEHENKKELTIQDLAVFVDKIRKVEMAKAAIEALRQKKVSDKEIADMFLNGTIEITADKMAANSKPLRHELIDDKTILWLNAFYSEDVVSRYFQMMRMITDDKYKLRPSTPVFNIMPFQKTSGKRNIALVVINNARIEIDTNIKVDMDNKKGHYVLRTKQYGDFDIKDAKSRLKYGKQNVFICLVRTVKEQDTERKQFLPELEKIKPDPVPEKPKEVKTK